MVDDDFDEDFSRWYQLPMSEYMPPLPVGPPYFQSERNRLDLFFLQRIRVNEDLKESVFSKEDVDPYEVIRELVTYPGNHLLDKLRHMSKVAKDCRFYHSVIRAILQYIHLLYNKEYLNRRAHKKELDCELEMLWQEMAKLGKQGCPPIEVCKLIIRHTVDDKRYRFVTESDLGELINFYALNLEDPSVFDDPYKDSCYFKNKKTPVLRDIKAVLKKTKSISRLGAGEHCRLLIKIVKDIEEQIPCLYGEVMKMVDMGAMKSLVENFEKSSKEKHLFGYSEDDITINLEINFAKCTYIAKRNLVSQMQQVIKPLFNLSDVDSLSVHQLVYEIIEIAEVRRHALGSRFIKRNHLLWAFHERGYGFPSKILHKMWGSSNREDHPLYHIYAVAVKLAQCFEGKMLRLEHFVFAILYAEVKHMDFDEKKRVEMQEAFKDFMEAVYLDTRQRFKAIDVGLKDLLSDTSLSNRRKKLGLLRKQGYLFSRFRKAYNENNVQL